MLIPVSQWSGLQTKITTAFGLSIRTPKAPLTLLKVPGLSLRKMLTEHLSSSEKELAIRPFCVERVQS
jgi:hypothetical protein